MGSQLTIPYDPETKTWVNNIVNQVKQSTDHLNQVTLSNDKRDPRKDYGHWHQPQAALQVRLQLGWVNLGF